MSEEDIPTYQEKLYESYRAQRQFIYNFCTYLKYLFGTEGAKHFVDHCGNPQLIEKAHIYEFIDDIKTEKKFDD